MNSFDLFFFQDNKKIESHMHKKKKYFEEMAPKKETDRW